ncbi:hypothetical protein NT6N_07180 [Oceaniferula spumae]|uniref:PDZ domain-containing protein n=1 Tax=Oceaniferula spumae TaxID=2979115 RepID=A0AAT9FI54_9BACT
MFKIVSAYAVIMGSIVIASAQAEPPIPGMPVPAKQANVSMGVGVVKPSDALYSQLPKLPRGCGFLLQSIAPGSSAEKSGLKVMDVIWKLDDQILINEGQMMTLLGLRKPGDHVKVSYFRSGKAQVTTLTLQPGTSAPANPEALVIAPPIPGLPAQPMRVISYEDRSASISDKTGTATLTYREGKLWLHVESDKGVETFNGTIENASELAHVPTVWRSRLPILRRSLEESLSLRKLPRIRRVPTPKHRIAGGE